MPSELYYYYYNALPRWCSPSRAPPQSGSASAARAALGSVGGAPVVGVLLLLSFSKSSCSMVARFPSFPGSMTSASWRGNSMTNSARTAAAGGDALSAAVGAGRASAARWFADTPPQTIQGRLPGQSRAHIPSALAGEPESLELQSGGLPRWALTAFAVRLGPLEMSPWQPSVVSWRCEGGQACLLGCALGSNAPGCAVRCGNIFLATMTLLSHGGARAQSSPCSGSWGACWWSRFPAAWEHFVPAVPAAAPCGAALLQWQQGQ